MVFRKLLDHSMILYGGGLADGNRHQHDELPVKMVSGALGTIKGGRHIQVTAQTPLNNLDVSMLGRVGVELKSWVTAPERSRNSAI
ncbi:MAG: hypothetical protein JWP08_4369 [Bryobacterales bacterium]|nr:hypothetical protein [Bryobacterales bacterium]